MTHPVIAIHGGAILDRDEDYIAGHDPEYLAALNAALDAGYGILKKKGSALDAIVAAINILEDCPLFDAAKGSVLKANGQVEMDASIMEGKTQKAGAVAGVTRVKNPINAARKVMEQSNHILLSREGADQFAREQGLEMVDPSYFHTDFQQQTYRRYQEKERKHEPIATDHEAGTVGAVALDMAGNLAAGTSTGGLAYGKFGRIGDSPIIGAGTYANNATCAISCTGWGEQFIRGVVAYDISALMEYKGLTLAQAAEEVIKKKQVALCGEGNIGGIIGVDRRGNTTVVWNTLGMCRGVIDASGKRTVAIFD